MMNKKSNPKAKKKPILPRDPSQRAINREARKQFLRGRKHGN